MIFDLSSLIPAISFIPYIIFTIFGLYRSKEEKIHWPFILYMFVMAIWSFGSFMMHANTGIFNPLFWNRLMVAGMLGGPITLFHSMLSLIQTRKRRYNYLVALGYLIYVFLLILNFEGHIVANAWFEGTQFYYSLAKGSLIAYILSYLFVVFGIFILLRAIRQTHSYDIKRKLRLPLYGAVIMLVGILTNLYEPLGRYPIDLFTSTVNAFFIFYAIYRFRLVYYSSLVLKIVLYFILIIICALVFQGILWVSFKGIRIIPFGYSILPSILLGIVAAFIFQPLRTSALSFMERLYFGKRLGYYNSLKNFSESLTSIVELDLLGESTVQIVYETFKLEWAFMTVLDYSSRNYQVIACRGMPFSRDDKTRIVFNRDSAFIRDISRSHGILVNQHLPVEVDLPLPEQNIQLKPSLILPLKFKDRLNGCIILGKCLNKEYYDQFDIEVLEILAGQCSSSLENAISFERLKRQQKRLQKLNQELIISRNKLEAFFDGITTPISIQDINYNIITVNYAARKYFGGTYEGIVGKKCYNTFFKRNKPCEKCLAQDCLHTQIPFSAEFNDEKTDRIFLNHFYPINVPVGFENIFLEFFLDITQQKRLQQELARSEKLAGIGTLASGIAHEINNPLCGILGTAEIMLDEMKGESALIEYTQDIIKYAQSAAEVIKELTNYSRKEEAETARINIVDVIEDSLKLARRGMKFEQIDIRKFYSDSPIIEANQNELQQVFLNIIINAVQAMDGRGLLTIECRVEDWNGIITITDTGQGIEEKNLENIFKPFFTTKDPGKGTGLGLNIVHQIIYKMGGRIAVNSQPGRGTSFTIFLPLTDENKQKIYFIHANTSQAIADVFFLQRKILVGEKGYLEETIRRPEDEHAYHILAYKGLQPVGTVSCLTEEMVDQLPIERHFPLNGLKGGKRCVEIDRLAVVNEERGNIVPLGLMTLAYLFAKSNKAERIFLDVFSDEKKYIQMYKKLGFQLIGEYKSPLPVTVMLLDSKTDYERKTQRMENFVRPFMSRLISKIEFENEEKQRILSAMEAIVGSRA
ncbi:MAG: GNAT family N-acetyltransferase [Spirochaetota bacterium]